MTLMHVIITIEWRHSINWQWLLKIINTESSRVNSKQSNVLIFCCFDPNLLEFPFSKSIQELGSCLQEVYLLNLYIFYFTVHHVHCSNMGHARRSSKRPRIQHNEGKRILIEILNVSKFSKIWNWVFKMVRRLVQIVTVRGRIDAEGSFRTHLLFASSIADSVGYT